MMPVDFLSIATTLFFGAAAAFLFVVFTDERAFVRSYYDRYTVWWRDGIKFLRRSPKYSSVPSIQLIGVVLVASLFAFSLQPVSLLLLIVLVPLPPILLHRQKRSRVDSLENDLDGFLTALADSLTTIPNLAGALESLIPNINGPIKSEVISALSEVKLGRSIDDALRNMSRRLALPGLDAAVGAALLGKRTGGDLPVILRQIATTQREMSRLEGVVKTKTAEGRSQAWVMGSVPPGLVFILEWINPEWLAPLWVDPIGWIMLGGAAVFEVIAIVLIRKIMAVEI